LNKNKGFVFSEIFLILLYVGTMAVSLSTLILLLHKTSSKNFELIKAEQLAVGLTEEILARAWEEKLNPSETLGIDSGEIEGDKTTFDDVDDFNNYIEAPPLTPSAQPMQGFSDFKRTAMVSYIKPGDGESSEKTELKKITVSVYKKDKLLVVLKSLKGRH